MKIAAAFLILLANTVSAQIVVEAPSSRVITEDVALGRCIAAINLAGKRPADASMPKVPGRTIDKYYLFRWKTASGFMNCQIAMDKRGKMKVFATAQ